MNTGVYKLVSDSHVEKEYFLMPKHSNGSGRLFGGQLLSWIDEVAGLVARRHSNHDVVTVAIDNLIFKSGAEIKDIVVIIGNITYVGKTSMEVRVDTYVENIDGKRTLINKAYFVMVALDKKQKPVKVPELRVSGASEKAEWDAGVKRAELRRVRRKEGC